MRRLPRPLKPAPLAEAIARSHPSKEAGFGLLGVILVVALSSAVAGVAYTVYLHSDRTRQVSQESANVSQINGAIQSSYASAPDFTGLTNTSALHDSIFVKGQLDATGSPRNTWGGDILVSAVDIAGHTGEGFAVTYEKVPSATCARFAAQGAPGFYDTKVNNQSIVNSKVVQMPAAVNLCSLSDTNTVQFIQVKQSPDGPSNPDLTPCVEAPQQAQQVACPAGQISSVAPYSVNGISQTRTSFCNSAYGQMGWNPWVTVGNTCAPICTAPAPTPTSQPLTGTCPAGQYVSGTTTSTFPQTQAGSISYTCPAPTGPYKTNAPVWGAITPPASSVCAPICTPPATQGQYVACPAGQAVPGPFPANYNGVYQQRTGACTGPTGSGYYNAWQTVSTSCAPVCSAPAPSSYNNYQWVGVNAGCPAGYTGSHTYQVQQYQTVSTSYSCPSVTGAYTSSTSVGGWANTGATQADSNTCTAPPPPPPACVKTNQVTVVSSQICVGYTVSSNSAPQKCTNNFVQGQLYTGSNRPNSATNYALSAAYTVVYNGQTFNVSGSCTVQTLNSLSTCNFPVGGSIPGLPGIYAQGFANTSGNPLGSVSLESSLASTCN